MRRLGRALVDLRLAFTSAGAFLSNAVLLVLLAWLGATGGRGSTVGGAGGGAGSGITTSGAGRVGAGPGGVRPARRKTKLAASSTTAAAMPMACQERKRRPSADGVISPVVCEKVVTLAAPRCPPWATTGTV